MRVALITYPYTHKIFSENLRTVDEEFCLAPPIILAYVAAILERHGHKVKIIDAKTLNLSKQDALRQLRVFNPDMLGFRSETYHFHDALEWIGYLKQNLNIPVVTGGINLSLYPKETLSHPEIDYGIIGEAIYSLPKLIGSLQYGDRIDDIPGVIYKKDGDVIINPPADSYIDFDAYPFPARHLLQNELYYSFISQLKNFTIMLTSTGCPYRCAFCAIHPNTTYRTRTPKNVVDEIESCYKEFGIREIDFFDATFFLNKARVSGIFDEIKMRRLKIEWSCRSRVDVVSEDILHQAAMAGCRQIYYGIESVDYNVLGNIKKDVKLEQVRQAVKWSKKQGIKAMGFFMVGNPGDTKERVCRTIDFAKDLDLDFIQVCMTIAKPGTELDKIMIEKTGRDYWREHILGKKIEERLPTPWAALSETEIKKLTKLFYIKFYFRLNIIWNRLIQLKSFEEIKRYLKAGWKILVQKSEVCSRILTDTSEAEKVLAESKRYLSEARQCKVAVVIPTYNEKDNIRGITAAIVEILPNAHIVIVDDNSPDGTGIIVGQLCRENANIHAIHRKGKKGLGLAYIDGFKFVLDNLDADFIFEMDADFSHNPQYLPIFLHYGRNNGLVTGSRFLNKVSIKNRVLWRNVISKLTKWLVNNIIGMRLTDVTTGFKCFHRGILQDIDFRRIKSNGFSFQIEMSYTVAQKGIAIKEVPIFFEERTNGISKMSWNIIAEGVGLIFYLASQRILRIFHLDI